MGVVIEAMNVVVRNATIERRLVGGVEEYGRHCPNGTACTDGDIVRIGFMDPADATIFIKDLKALGFEPPTADGSPEVALIEEVDGLVFPCDWLEVGRVDLGGGESACAAWLRGKAMTRLVAPPDWKPNTTQRVSVETLRDDYEFLRTEEGVATYRHRATGEILYVGRTRPTEGAPYSKRLDHLARGLADAGGWENAPAGPQSVDLESLFEQAEGARRGDPGDRRSPAVLSRDRGSAAGTMGCGR